MIQQRRSEKSVNFYGRDTQYIPYWAINYCPGFRKNISSAKYCISEILYPINRADNFSPMLPD